MPYDARLADRIRSALSDEADVREQPMFGGLAFMVGGHMAAGVLRDELIVRVGTDGFDDLLAQPHVRVFDFTGRPSRGMVFVGQEALTTDSDLRTWVERGLAHARSRPPR